ncbi:MAG: hypothetical protein WDN28_29425 [Chthoniobacter sp.]
MLVIIGLLIGGILAAQSMIGTAKVQGVVRQLQQYDMAVSNFQTKYNQLPGDSILFSALGNNDGIVGSAYPQEVGAFWADLSLGVGLKNTTGQDFHVFDVNTDTVFEKQIPQFNIDQKRSVKTGLFVSQTDIGNGTKNYWLYWGFGGDTWWSGPSGGGAFKPIDFDAIDTKIDDGVANSGKVIGSGWSGFSCASGASYNVSNSDYVCFPAIELGYTVN